MDKNQLITIAVTAGISVIAKEVVQWLWTVLKNLSTLNTIKAKLKSIFTKTNRKILWALGSTIFYLVVIVSFVRDESPTSRFDMLLIVLFVGALAVSVMTLLWRIAMWQIKREDAKKQGPN